MKELLFIACVLSCAATVSHAAIIHVEVQGVVTSNYDNTGAFFGEVGNDFLAGEQVTVRYAYDSTDPLLSFIPLNPAVPVPAPGVTDWLDSDFAISNFELPGNLARSTTFNPYDQYIGVGVDVDGSGLQGFSVWDQSTYLGQNSLSGKFHVRTRAYFAEYLDDVILSDSLAPDYPISWLDNDDTDFGGGAIEVFFQDAGSVVPGFGTQPGGIKIANVDFDATSVTLTPVPIPSALWLFCSGVGIFVFRFWRQKAA
jgi:hypothetical protein